MATFSAAVVLLATFSGLDAASPKVKVRVFEEAM